ncbi:hypothetical protein [Infirmifilum sp. NZ]|uniref:hypothetical protein n=1 Tax=Infirmifilum sp. NZ TaxID=2926850 RepID=UPI0027A5777A|nr:hypothetical protein [Infirmifilum sp. NZ]UNQ74290.1 hypothetical protein MOV14_04600 [Infirmifilum sp. NZ]
MESYIAVRAHGLKSRLLKRQDYEAILSGEKKLYELRDYALISDRDSLEEALEKIYRVYVQRIETLAKPDRVLGQFAYALLDRLEVENAKIHLRYIRGAQRPVIYYPYGRHIGPARLSQIRTEGGLWEELSKTPLQAPSTPSFSSGLEAEREALLELLYYKYLLNMLKELPVNKEEKEDLEALIREEASLKMVVWSRTLSQSIVEKLAQGYLKGYGIMSPQLPEEWSSMKLTELLLHVQRTVISRAEQLAMKHSLDIAYIYYFNHLALAEANNLERILLGKEIRLPEEVIQRNLVIVV